MKRNDFEDIWYFHLETCKRIIELNGICSSIDCSTCPFHQFNNPQDRKCKPKYKQYVNRDIPDNLLVNKSCEFIELFSDYFKGEEYVEI